jgi:hypothetical protein
LRRISGDLDRAAHEVERIREGVEKAVLVAALGDTQQHRGRRQSRGEAEEQCQSWTVPHHAFDESNCYDRRDEPGQPEMRQPDPVAGRCESRLEPLPKRRE